MRRGKCSELELQGSAWLHEKDLTLTVVNLHVSQVRETEIGRARRCAEVGIGNNAHPLRHSRTPYVCPPGCRDPANEGLEVKGRTLHYAFLPTFGYQVDVDSVVGAIEDGGRKGIGRKAPYYRRVRSRSGKDESTHPI